MQRLLETWAGGAKDRELVRALEILKLELRRRGMSRPVRESGHAPNGVKNGNGPWPT